MTDPLYEANLRQNEQLDPSVRWAADAMLSDCWADKKRYDIESARRTQSEQDFIFTKGRTEAEVKSLWIGNQLTNGEFQRLRALYLAGKNSKEKVIRTWTLDSEHIKGKALDILPVKCTHADIEAIAKRYGIVRNLLPRDPPHYSLTRVGEPPMTVTPQAHLKGLERRLKNEKDEQTIKLLTGERNRLKKRLGL